MTERTDENTLEAARLVLEQPAPPPPPPSRALVPYDAVDDASGPHRQPKRRGRTAVFIAAVALVLAAAAAAVWALNDRDGDAASSTTSTSPPSTTVPTAGVVLTGVLGPVDGTTDVDDEPVAYPGELVTAPTPPDGEPVAWQWQLCPEADSGPDDCTAIGEATAATWMSPPTPEPVFIRVLVTIDLDGVLVQATSETYTAMDERPAPTTTEAPTTTRPPTTTAAPTTTVPTNAYGDQVGATVTDAASPPAAFALAAADRAATTPAAGTNQVQLLLRWIELRTAGAEPGSVVATDTGYQVTVGGNVFELSDFVVSDDDTISDLRICLDAGSCAKASEAVYVAPACEAGAEGCPTVASASRATTAIHRGTVTGVAPGPELMYETVSERPITDVALDTTVGFSSGWFVIMLPSQPPDGAAQELAVTYGDDPAGDTITITY